MKYFVARPDNRLGLKSGKYYHLNRKAPLVGVMLAEGQIKTEAEMDAAQVLDARKVSTVVSARKSRRKKKTNQ